MIVTFKGLRDLVLRHLDESEDQGTTYALVGDALNAAHLQRCTEFPWKFLLWDQEEQLVTVAGQVSYALHPELLRPLYVRSVTTGQLLREVPLRELASAETPLEETSQGSALEFFLSGHSPVARQPASAGLVSIVSSSGADYGAENQIVIKGETADGDVAVDVLTPSGQVSVVSTIPFRKILAVTKETEWAGTLELRDAGGALLLRLYPKEMGRKYPQLTLLRPPAGGETLAYRFFRQPLLLVNDYDQPELPAPFARILVWDALLELQAYLSNPNPATLEIWKGKQAEMQAGLYQAWANEGDTLGARGSFVRAVPEGSF